MHFMSVCDRGEMCEGRTAELSRRDRDKMEEDDKSEELKKQRSEGKAKAKQDCFAP